MFQSVLEKFRYLVPYSIFSNMDGTNPSANMKVQFCDLETIVKRQIYDLRLNII